MVEYIQELMVKKHNMREVWLPLEKDAPGRAANNIFFSGTIIEPIQP